MTQPSRQPALPDPQALPTRRKLIIQLPCFNEVDALPVAVAALPRSVEGFDVVEYLVIDDGSTDHTAQVARDCGVHHVVRHTTNKGLARAFMTGLDAALRLGATVIVNTDADNQYDARDLPALVAPVVDGRADIVIGARPIAAISHFSPVKKLLQHLGSFVVRATSGTSVPDAPSGFRAMSRRAAQELMVFNAYTYTLETIIQAGHKNMAIMSVPVRVNPDLRPSRLVRSISSYVLRSTGTIVRIFVIYKPMKFFGTLSAVLLAGGLSLCLRFLWYFIRDGSAGHVQSLILAAILLLMGFQSLLVAFTADLLAANRKLLEDVRLRLARIEEAPALSGEPLE